jgi:hypothetical protein
VAAAATTAVTASLALAPAVVDSASAAPGRGASVTEECAAAQTAHALARSAQARSHRKLALARKALRKAKHSHRAPAIRKAKRHLKVAKRRYVARTHNTRVQTARVGYACSAPNSSARAAGTGMKLDLLAVATGSAGKVIDATQLAALLEDLLPGITGHLDQGQLNALLSGFNAGTPSLDSLTVLLGSDFTPDQLTALLGGSPDPALVQALVENVIGELSGLSGVPVPGTLDATALQAIVTTVTGLLGGLPTGAATGGTTGGTGGTGGGLTCLVVPLVGTVCV